MNDEVCSQLEKQHYKIQKIEDGFITATCPVGHELEISRRAAYYQIRSKEQYDCGVCRAAGRWDGREAIIKRIESFGYKILSVVPESINENVMVKLECDNGHTTDRRICNFKEAPHCKNCRGTPASWYYHARKTYTQIKFVEKTSSNKAKVLIAGLIKEYSIQQLMKMYSIELSDIYGYEVLAENTQTSYRADRTKAKYRCQKGHEFETSRRNLLEGHGCRECAVQNINEPETFIGEWIESRGIQIIRRNTIILQGQELDIFIPTKNVAIEYTGIRWHSEEMFHQVYGKRPNFEERLQKFKEAHRKKTLECQKLGIHLITVFEPDYRNSRDFLKKMIFDALDGKDLNTTDGRYCRLSSSDRLSDPHKVFYNRKLEQVSESKKHYTVYDCGHKL